MSRSVLSRIGATIVGCALVALCGPALSAQSRQVYPAMAPLNDYLMPLAEEIALARSAAPPAISANATVLTLRRDGYHRAVAGSNGFVCMVFRSWTGDRMDPEFWNPRIHSPLCLNAPAADTYLPLIMMRTNLILNGKSKDAAFAAVTAAIDDKRLAPVASGAMCYMMSRHQRVSDVAKAWHPHLMFFMQGTVPPAWGANLQGSPVLESSDEADRVTIFLVPVTEWSDGTVAPPWRFP